MKAYLELSAPHGCVFEFSSVRRKVATFHEWQEIIWVVTHVRSTLSPKLFVIYSDIFKLQLMGNRVEEAALM
jgi:hypothetical protein